MTRNHSYNTPQQGATDWNVPLNRNFERLDRDVEIRDAKANRSEYAPKEGAKFLAIDTGEQFVGDGSSWSKVPTPGGSGGGTGTSQVFVTDFPGSDLSEKVMNAQAQLVEEGRPADIHVPAKKGGPWIWGTDLDYDIDANDLGFSLVCDANAYIEYPGDGFPLAIRKSWDTTPKKGTFNLTGGIWHSTGEATGWLRSIDNVRAYVHPNYVDFRTGGDVEHPDRNQQGSVAISLENRDVWNELNTFKGDYKTDNGIDFRPSGVTGGGGTSSFQSNTFENMMVNCHAAGGFNLRLRGNLQYTKFDRVSLHLNGEGCRGVVFAGGGTGFQGLSFYSIKWEQNQHQGTGIGIETQDAFDAYYGPIFVGSHMSGTIGTEIAGPDGTEESADTRIPHYSAVAGRAAIQGFGSSTYDLRFKVENGELVINGPNGEQRLD